MAKNSTRRLLIPLLVLVAGWALTADCAPVPYRFLLVIGNQWKDPASRLIEAGGEFPVVVTGYVDRKARRVVSPWKQQVLDELDGRTFHDYVSAKRGLDAGQRAGVLEIQCHGYTHMLPDLESPPGPFWTVPMDANVPRGFDEEFGDRLRKKDVPVCSGDKDLRLRRET